MHGKLIINKPTLCVCFIKINGKSQKLESIKNKEELELPFGIYKINVGIGWSDTTHVQMDRPEPWDSGIEWAWEKSKEIVIDEKITIIKIKRKWHLLKHVTTEATMSKSRDILTQLHVNLLIVNNTQRIQMLCIWILCLERLRSRYAKKIYLQSVTPFLYNSIYLILI